MLCKRFAVYKKEREQKKRKHKVLITKKFKKKSKKISEKTFRRMSTYLTKFFNSISPVKESEFYQCFKKSIQLYYTKKGIPKKRVITFFTDDFLLRKKLPLKTREEIIELYDLVQQYLEETTIRRYIKNIILQKSKIIKNKYYRLKIKRKKSKQPALFKSRLRELAQINYNLKELKTEVLAPLRSFLISGDYPRYFLKLTTIGKNEEAFEIYEQLKKFYRTQRDHLKLIRIKRRNRKRKLLRNQRLKRIRRRENRSFLFRKLKFLIIRRIHVRKRIPSTKLRLDYHRLDPNRKDKDKDKRKHKIRNFYRSQINLRLKGVYKDKRPKITKTTKTKFKKYRLIFRSLFKRFRKKSSKKKLKIGNKHFYLLRKLQKIRKFFKRRRRRQLVGKKRLLKRRKNLYKRLALRFRKPKRVYKRLIKKRKTYTPDSLKI